MRITEHLEELRKRLLWVSAGIVVASVVGWFLSEPVLYWMQEPLREASGSKPQLNFQTIGAAFDLKLRVSLWLGVLLSSPWWIFQLMAYIFPGLKSREKLYLSSFGLTGILLFGLGAWSGILVVPKAVDILNSFTPEGAVVLLRADSYLTFFMRLVLAFGLSFLLPEVLVVLNFVGVLKARMMIKGWRWAVVATFTFAAIANPLPTVTPMIIQGSILMLLYLLAVGISAVHDYIKRHGQWHWCALLKPFAEK